MPGDAVSAQVVRYSSIPPTPWENGRGYTVELWRTPATGAFTTRLSIATVDGPAPFSSLPGVERTLLCLAPAGLVLQIEGRRIVLDRLQCATFRGDQAAAALEVPTPGLDLNLMSRGGGTQISLVRVDGRYETPANAVAVVVIEGVVVALGSRLDLLDAVIGGPTTIEGDGLVAVASVHERVGS